MAKQLTGKQAGALKKNLPTFSINSMLADENIKPLKNYAPTLASLNTFLIAVTIFSPLSLICSSVQTKLIAVLIQRLIIASLALKFCVVNWCNATFCSTLILFYLVSCCKCCHCLM